MQNVELGRLGEEEAVRHLRTDGWVILGRNVRWGKKEVDVIASRGWVLAFIEVKARRGRRHGHPLEAITGRKRREIAGVARAWLEGRPLPPGTVLRFDAISVLYPIEGRPEVRHVPDAWRLD